MSKFDEELVKYQAQLAEIVGDGNYQPGFLELEAKKLGPNIYDADASLVSCTDQAEIDRVKATFKKRFEGVEDAVIDQAIADVCQEMSGIKRKYRAVFYYRVTVRLGEYLDPGCSG